MRAPQTCLSDRSAGRAYAECIRRASLKQQAVAKQVPDHRPTFLPECHLEPGQGDVAQVAQISPAYRDVTSGSVKKTPSSEPFEFLHRTFKKKLPGKAVTGAAFGLNSARRPLSSLFRSPAVAESADLYGSRRG